MRACGGRCGGRLRLGVETLKVKTWPCFAWGGGGHVTPKLGAVGIPNAVCAFACVNLFRISNLDFPWILLVYIRKQKNRCVRPSRKHIDSAGVHRKPYHHGRSVPSAGCFDAPIFRGECTERGRPVKALRYAPTAGAAQKTRGLDLPPSPLLCVSSYRKNVKNNGSRGAE
jgi:hypothetical protein